MGQWREEAVPCRNQLPQIRNGRTRDDGNQIPSTDPTLRVVVGAKNSDINVAKEGILGFHHVLS